MYDIWYFFVYLLMEVEMYGAPTVESGRANSSTEAPQQRNRGAATNKSGRPDRLTGAPKLKSRGAATEKSGRKDG